MLGGCGGWVAGCVLGMCWVSIGWVWPVCRKLELLLLPLLERSMETRSLQDLVSHPRRWLSKESQAGEFVELLLAEGSRASAVGKS